MQQLRRVSVEQDQDIGFGVIGGIWPRSCAEQQQVGDRVGR